MPVSQQLVPNDCLGEAISETLRAAVGCKRTWKGTSLRTVVLIVVQCLSGCATCPQHPVMCGLAVMALTTGAVYVATQNSSNTLQQYCRVLPDGAVRCGRAP